MITPIFQVDAFTRKRFAGNPAAVMPLAVFPPDEIMQALAAENNLAETAFLVGTDGQYQLRWFTPTVEVPLCGHATLASGAVVLERLERGRQNVVFHTASGRLEVRKSGGGYVMDLPAHKLRPAAIEPAFLEAIGADVVEVATYVRDLLVLLRSADAVRNLVPDFAKIAALDCTGIVVTAASDGDYDFVSRYFAPANGIPEDPVTGGAHCALVPFWAQKTGRTEFRGFQASTRGGEIQCRLIGDRVELEGHAVFYLEGSVEF